MVQGLFLLLYYEIKGLNEVGLDTYLVKIKESENINDYFCSWRKCYGIDAWLNFKSVKYNDYIEFDCSILKPIIKKMSLFIKKLINELLKLNYIEEDEKKEIGIEDLRLLLCSIEATKPKVYNKLENYLVSFNIDNLNIDAFKDSIWGSLDTFLITYINFKKAINYNKLYLVSSF